jgi:MoaA/NifB/PqqE/SkfB family radical SAM enzyme
LIAVTNACNLTCPFCYRDLDSRSLWRYETLLDFCQEADQWGVMEIALGGGEPMLFPRWLEFIRELYDTTGLCLNFTTNGMLITEEFLRDVAGCYGQLRVSLYDDNDWMRTVQLLAKNKARFGVNWLISPDQLAVIEEKFVQLLALGVRDFLLLGYKGADPALHLKGDDYQKLARFVNGIYQRLGSAVQIKLDICWGNSLPNVPRLFVQEDCGAGDDFLSITSDKHVKDCSFQGTAMALHFDTVADLRRLWEERRLNKRPALLGGCARLPNRGLGAGGHHAYIDLAAVQ